MSAQPRAEAPRYALSPEWEHEQRRLALLEQVWDSTTTARLAALGVGPGARCLELGAGGGSIVRSLCEQVGSSGAVTATDLDTRWLDQINEPNLTVTQHDLLTDDFPAGSFDFIHARAVLEHIADRERALERIYGWLAPGGWLYLEDCATFSIQATPNPLYAKAMGAWIEILARTGTNYSWARTFPEPLIQRGLEDIGAEVDVPVLRPSSGV
jgi:ubiquinone/menaquinone biosynthesis C-methylase UbiE